MLMKLQLMADYLANRVHGEDRGASAVEYGLLVALIAVVIIAAVTTLGGNLAETFEYVAERVVTPED